MVEMKFTKRQYENLIKLVYLGNWMVNAIRIDRIKKYEDIEQYIYSFAKKIGLDSYIVFDNECNKFFPTKDFEENTDIEKYRGEYNEENFWSELIDRLARRDFIKEYGMRAIRKMDWKKVIEKEHPFIEKYEDEFEKYGLVNLEIKKKD